MKLYLIVNGKCIKLQWGFTFTDPGCRIRMIGPHRRMALGFEPYCGIDPPHAGRWLGSDADQAAGFEPWCFYKVKGCGTAFGSLPWSSNGIWLIVNEALPYSTFFAWSSTKNRIFWKTKLPKLSVMLLRLVFSYVCRPENNSIKSYRPKIWKCWF